jgi:intracellular multiplication protein IcmD
VLVLLAAACPAMLTGAATAQAQASAARHATSTRVQPPPTASSSIAVTVSAAHGLIPLAGVVDNQKTRSALRTDASDEPSFDKLTHVIFAAAYISGLGFAVTAIVKFKAHKDNPQQTVLGKPTALVFTGASIPFIDKATATAGASVFAQASEARTVAADERNQAGANLTRSELPRIVRPAQPPAPPPRTSSQNRRLRRLVALEHTQLADETRLARASQAEVTAVRHSSTAAKAGDRVAYSRDRMAVIRSLRQEATLLEQLATMRHRAAATFAAIGIGLRATHRGMVKLAAYLSVHGLLSARRGLRRLGVSPTSVGLAGLSSSQLASEFRARGSGFALSRLFAGVARQAAADLRLARQLRADAGAVNALR